VNHLNFVARLGQTLAHLLGNHHRAMLAPGTAEGDCQIALTLADIVRNQIYKVWGNDRMYLAT
jgi:hypothetical protein